MKASAKVTLSKTELFLAQKWGEARYNNARSKGVFDAKIGDQSCAYTDQEGMAAELAFCKLFNIYPDLNLALDHEYDCEYKGKKVDVKVTKYKTGKLLATLKKKASDIDVFALMVGENGTYEFKGFAYFDELVNDANIGNLGKGNGYVLGQEKLRYDI